MTAMFSTFQKNKICAETHIYRFSIIIFEYLRLLIITNRRLKEFLKPTNQKIQFRDQSDCENPKSLLIPPNLQKLSIKLEVSVWFIISKCRIYLKKFTQNSLDQSWAQILTELEFSRTNLITVTGNHFYIPDCFCIFVYVSNYIMRDIYIVFSVFFISAPVNSVLYNMLILIYEQHSLVNGIVLCVLLQMFSLKHITFSLVLLQSFSFLSQLYPPLLFILLSDTSSLVFILLLGLSFALVLDSFSFFNLLRRLSRFYSIFITSLLAIVLLFSLSRTFLLISVSLVNLLYDSLCSGLISTACFLVFVLLLGLPCTFTLVINLRVAFRLFLQYLLLTFDLHNVFIDLCVTVQSVICVSFGFCVIFIALFVLCVFSCFCIIFMMERSSPNSFSLQIRRT